jgi:tRNA-dihydrouridine synthase B
MSIFLYLAPLRGFTNALFRRIFFAHFEGIDAAIAPFISTLSVKQIRRVHIKDVLPENNPDAPLIPQLIGNDPEAFLQLAQRFSDLGYDTVNWNLGCPFQIVANKRRGSGMLPYPNLIDAFLERVMSASPIRISIKTRIGRMGKEEFFKLIPVFNRYPLAELIIHPRTGIQMYTGEVDLDTFEQSLSLLTMPVVYNGDISDYPTFVRLKNRFPGISRWMIGRGALANPFLPAIIRSKGKPFPTPSMVQFKAFHDDLYAAYQTELSGQAHLLGKMKGYWQFFSLTFENGQKIFKKIKKVNSIRKYEALVEKSWDSEILYS